MEDRQLLKRRVAPIVAPVPRCYCACVCVATQHRGRSRDCACRPTAINPIAAIAWACPNEPVAVDLAWAALPLTVAADEFAFVGSIYVHKPASLF
jgi:hypothetical protein